MTTIATLFSGGEGVGVGARAAGLEHLWGVESIDNIAEVARANGFNTLTGDVRDRVLMYSLPRPDVLHASPVCKNASSAKAHGEESPLDIETADATCAYIDHFKPDVFTLENVWGYRTFEAFTHILICLKRNGYKVDYWHLNSADYGVPQTRKRLILIAALRFKPIKPLATHAQPDKLTSIFDTRLPWVGWYESIADLIDTLPESKFARWQLERLPQELQGSAIFGNDQSDDRKGTKTGYGVITRQAPQPMIVVRPTYVPYAFIVNGTPNDNGESVTACAQDDPSFTMTGSIDKRSVRAFIVTDQSSQAGQGVQVLDDDEPSTALRSFETGGGLPKAFIMPNANTSSGVMRQSDEPAPTQGNVERVGNQPRAWLSKGRVVKMTPRALARLQSFPDSYILPDKAKLACTVIGNSVCPLLYQRIAESYLRQLDSV